MPFADRVPSRPSAPGKVFVTGPDGLLGSSTVRELVRRGYQVVAFVEPDRNPKTLAGIPRLEIVRGDIRNALSVVRAMHACNYVVNIAAVAKVWPSRAQAYFDINVRGTKNVIEASLVHQVSRFVHVSSSNVFGYGSAKSSPGNEDLPWPGDNGMDYIRSKRHAHDTVMRSHSERGLPPVIICPGIMFGPYDSEPSSGRFLVTAWNRPPKFCTRGGKSFIYAKDVAVGICNALIKGRIGESYFCTSENLEIKEIFALIELITGKKQPRFVAPAILVLIIGWIMDRISTLTGRQPLLTAPVSKSANLKAYYDPTKAIREIDLPQTQ